MTAAALRRLAAPLTAVSGLAVLIGGAFAPWSGAVSDAVAIAACAAWLGGSAVTVAAMSLRRRRAAARCAELERTDPERLLRAAAYGATVEAIKGDALRQGAALFGPDARLEICGVKDITTALRTDKGAFCATVTVRMLPGSPAGGKGRQS